MTTPEERPLVPEFVTAEEIVPDDHGNWHVKFGDGTAAVHTKKYGWVEVRDEDEWTS